MATVMVVESKHGSGPDVIEKADQADQSQDIHLATLPILLAQAGKYLESPRNLVHIEVTRSGGKIAAAAFHPLLHASANA